MKKLQVALDLFSEKAALEVLSEVVEYVDVIELGTPLVMIEDVGLIGRIKEKYPDKIVFADIKIMDGGGVLSKIVFDAGADMVSVLAAAEDNTVRASIDCAREYGKLVLVDMCSVKNIEKRAKEIDEMAPDFVCVHVGYDIQSTGADPIEDLHKINVIKTKTAIAGGINLSNFNEVVRSSADLIIVGGGLCNQPNRADVAREMRSIIEKN